MKKLSILFMAGWLSNLPWFWTTGKTRMSFYCDFYQPYQKKIGLKKISPLG